MDFTKLITRDNPYDRANFINRNFFWSVFFLESKLLLKYNSNNLFQNCYNCNHMIIDETVIQTFKNSVKNSIVFHF